jgi:hypothetical protein
MSETPTSTSGTETRKLRRLLREITKTSRESSLTGALKKGAPTSIRTYNSVLEHLERAGEVPPGLFPTLDEHEAGVDEVGVAAAQLAGYLDDDEETTGGPGSGSAGSNNSVIIGLGGLKEVKELKELGRVIRDQLPEWLKGKVSGHEEGEDVAASLSEVESRLAEAGARLQAVAEQLRRGDLTDAQREQLAEQLSQLGKEQAKLARQRAALRERQEEPAA